MEDDWPPHEDEYFPRRIWLRLQTLTEITEIRGTSWVRDRAKVGVWPYDDEIVAAVAERLAPLAADVYPKPTIPHAV